MKKIVSISIVIFAFFMQGDLFAQNLLWSPLELDIGNQIKFMIADKLNRLIVQSEKGVFVVKDLTKISRIDTLLPDSVKISCIAIDSSNIIYGGTENNGIYSYDDSLKKWKVISQNLTSKKINYLTISNNHSIAAWVDNESVFLHNQNDSLWRKVKNNVPILNFIRYSYDNDLFANISGDLFKIELNYLQEYTLIPTTKKCNDFNNINSKQNVLYATSDNCKLFFSYDAGRYWTKANDGLDNIKDLVNILLTKNNEYLLLSKTMGVYYSNNNLISFESNNSGLSTDSVVTGVILSDERIVVLIKNSGLFVSEKAKNIPIKVSGWEDKEKYLEKNISDENIRFLKFSNDKKFIYVMSGGEFRVIDVNSGNVIKRTNFPRQYLSVSKISDDDSTIILCYSDKNNALNINYKVYSTSNDTLVIKYDLRYYIEIMFSLKNYSFVSSVSDYSFKDRHFWCGFTYYLDLDGSSAIQTYKGFAYDFYENTGKFNQLIEIPVANLLRLTNGKSIVFANQMYSSYDFQTQKSGYSDFNYLYIYDENNIFIKTLYYSGRYTRPDNSYIQINKIFLIDDENTLGTFLSNRTIYLWDINTLTISDSLKFNKYPIDFKFSKNNKYIIAGFDSGISIFDRKMNIIDSIPFIIRVDSIPFLVNYGFSWFLVTSPDSTSFAVGDNLGNIKLFKRSILTNVRENINISSSEKNIFPNPVTDFLQISGIDPMLKQGVAEVIVYDILGVAYTPPNPLLIEGEQLRLDVSGLVQGVYFVKIGDRVQRFVKM